MNTTPTSAATIQHTNTATTAIHITIGSSVVSVHIVSVHIPPTTTTTTIDGVHSGGIGDTHAFCVGAVGVTFITAAAYLLVLSRGKRSGVRVNE